MSKVIILCVLLVGGVFSELSAEDLGRNRIGADLFWPGVSSGQIISAKYQRQLGGRYSIGVGYFGSDNVEFGSDGDIELNFSMPFISLRRYSKSSMRGLYFGVDIGFLDFEASDIFSGERVSDSVSQASFGIRMGKTFIINRNFTWSLDFGVQQLVGKINIEESTINGVSKNNDIEVEAGVLPVLGIHFEYQF